MDNQEEKTLRVNTGLIVTVAFFILVTFFIVVIYQIMRIDKLEERIELLETKELACVEIKEKASEYKELFVASDRYYQKVDNRVRALDSKVNGDMLQALLTNEMWLDFYSVIAKQMDKATRTIIEAKKKKMFPDLPNIKKENEIRINETVKIEVDIKEESDYFNFVGFENLYSNIEFENEIGIIAKELEDNYND